MSDGTAVGPISCALAGNSAQQAMKAQLMKQARERLRLITPEKAGKVLGHDRYWTVPFLNLYLDLCDSNSYDRPLEGYMLSLVAPILAQRIPVHGAGSYASDDDRSSWLVRALAVHGSCCLVDQRPSEADLAFRRAQQIEARTAHVSPLAQAEFDRRQAVMLGRRNEPRALVLADQAINILAELDEQERLADALILRGNLRRSHPGMNSAADYAAAVVEAPKSNKNFRQMTAALHFLAHAVAVEDAHVSHQSEAYALIGRVKKLMVRAPLSPHKAKLSWVEGMLLANMGITRLAIRRLQKARRGLLALGEARDYAMVSLELASVHRLDGDPQAERVVAEEASHELARLDTADSELLKALAPWFSESLPPNTLGQLRLHLLEPQLSNHWLWSRAWGRSSFKLCDPICAVDEVL